MSKYTYPSARSMSEVAFLHHYGLGTVHVTLYNDTWPATIQLHASMWRQMLERRLLPWAVADVRFEQIETGEYPDRLTFVPGRKDGRVQFSMADGQWAEYAVTHHDEAAGVYTLQYIQEGHQLPPRVLS